MTKKLSKTLKDLCRERGDRYWCYCCHDGFEYLSKGGVKGGIPKYCPDCYGSSWIEL